MATTTMPPATNTWDSTVANHALPKGDAIAVWNKKILLGSSVIDEMCSTAESKDVQRSISNGLIDQHFS